MANLKRLIALVLGAYGGVILSAQSIDNLTVTTDEEHPVYYLIQNWKTKQFYLDSKNSERIWSTEGITIDNSTSGLINPSPTSSNHTADNYLFYFVASGNGYKIGSKTAGSGLYFDSSETWGGINKHFRSSQSGSETGFTQTGEEWTIHRCQYNNIGVEISKGNQYWQADKSSGYYYINLQTSSDVDDQVWLLWSYDDLRREATKHGLDFAEKADPTGDDFKTITDAIKAKQTTDYLSSFISNFTDGTYLIRNRQYGTFLNSNATSLSATSIPTQYSAWKISRTLERVTIQSAANDKFIFVENSGTTSVSWNLGSSGSKWETDFAVSSDNNNGYITFLQAGSASRNSDNRWLGMGKTGSEGLGQMQAEAKSRNGSNIRPSADWQLIPVVDGKYTIDGTEYSLYESIESEAELIPEDNDRQKAQYFRIINATRKVSTSGDDRFCAGGMLEDVDHTHFTYRKSETASTAYLWDIEEADYMYSARTVDFYAAEANMSHASALWDFIIVGHAADGNESATGHILPEHNIFVIRNVNTGKYIKGSDPVNTDGKYFPTTTSLQTEAARFYLERLIDGQYGLHVYNGTSGSGVDATTGGCVYIDGTSDGYQGGLSWLNSKQPAMNTQSAWIVSPAPTIELPILIREVERESGKDHHLYDWTTFYYPFDVVIDEEKRPAEQTIEIFAGQWDHSFTADDGTITGAITMTPVADVVANSPVFLRSNKTDANETYGIVTFRIYPPNSGHTTTTEQSFAGNIWKGIIESEEREYFSGSHSNDWKLYWILTRNSKHYLKLMHPGGNYLLPNRAYIDSGTMAMLTNAKVAAFDLSVGDPIYEDDTEEPVNPDDPDNPETPDDPGDDQQSESRLGIDETATISNGKAEIYALDGRKIETDKLQKGIYIIDNRKVIVK